jgi:hypothetical protein
MLFASSLPKPHEPKLHPGFIKKFAKPTQKKILKKITNPSKK